MRSYKGPINNFLKQELANNRNKIPADKLLQSTEAEVFAKAAELAYEVFGPDAFRQWDAKRKKFKSTINLVLYDTVMQVWAH